VFSTIYTEIKNLEPKKNKEEKRKKEEIKVCFSNYFCGV